MTTQNENLKSAAINIVCADKEENDYFAIEDLQKAIVYLQNEIKRREQNITNC